MGFRYRSKGPGLVIVPDDCRVYNWEKSSSGDLTVHQDSTHDRAVSFEELVTTDVVTPNYHSRRSNGEIISNPYESTFTYSNMDDVTVRFYRAAQAGPPYITEREITFTGRQNQPFPDRTLGYDEDLVNGLIIEAATAALANANAPGFEGGVFVGEWAKTVRMVRNPMNQLVKLIFRKSKRKKASTVGGWKDLVKDAKSSAKSAAYYADVIANSWLELRFGWRPLVMEIDNLVQAALDNSTRRTARATRIGTSVGSDDVDIRVSGNFDCHVNRTWHHQYTARAGILYDLNSSRFGRMGVRMRDIPAAAWELLPFSFVVDWFGHIGNYIQASVPNLAVNPLTSWSVLKTLSTVQYNYVPFNTSSFPSDIQTGSWYSQTISRVNRRRIGELSAGVNFKMPIYDWYKASDPRLADIVTLIYVLGRNKGKAPNLRYVA